MAWSPFASVHVRDLEIPGADGQRITIRKLGWKELERAQQLAQEAGARMLAAIGGARVMTEIAAMGGADAAKAQGAVDPILGFDRLELISRGVQQWPDGLTPDREALERLDAEFADWLSREIFELSRPRSETERKNASGGSASSSTGSP